MKNGRKMSQPAAVILAAFLIVMAVTGSAAFVAAQSTPEYVYNVDTAGRVYTVTSRVGEEGSTVYRDEMSWEKAFSDADCKLINKWRNNADATGLMAVVDCERSLLP